MVKTSRPTPPATKPRSAGPFARSATLSMHLLRPNFVPPYSTSLRKRKDGSKKIGHRICKPLALLNFSCAGVLRDPLRNRLARHPALFPVDMNDLGRQADVRAPKG